MNTKYNNILLNNKIILPFILDNNINCFFNKSKLINRMSFYFLFENKSSNRILLLLKYMLIEKLTNNKVKFVYDKKILITKKIVTGCTVNIKKQKLFNYLLTVFLYSFSKLLFESDFDSFFLNDSKFTYDILFFSLNKVLFFNFFNYNNDYYKYLHYFEDPCYNLKIKLKTRFKYYLMNRKLFRLLGINIY